MSEVKRFNVHPKDMYDSDWWPGFPKSKLCVLASDYDALARQLEDAKSGRAMWEERTTYLETVRDSLNKQLDEARAELARAIAWKEDAMSDDDCEAKLKLLRDDYEAKCKPLLDDYEEKWKPLFDDYMAKRQSLWDDHNATLRRAQHE